MVLIDFKRDERPVDVQVGDLHIRLAESEAEVDAAQALRYRVFYEEMQAQPSKETQSSRRDRDSFDPFCDHLVVLDRKRGSGAEAVIGTYRVMRRGAAEKRGQFYSSDEYDIGSLLAYPGEILELGRSCVDADYRKSSTMQLLWRGIAEYVLHYDIQLLFGCASLHGTDPDAMAPQLSYLYHHHLAPPALRPVALAERYVSMNRMNADAIDQRRALATMPPLVKGYLRLGGFVGDGAVVDYQFNTTDVCVVVKTDQVTDKYYRHYTTGRKDAAEADG
jgi:putative hemolysin